MSNRGRARGRSTGARAVWDRSGSRETAPYTQAEHDTIMRGHQQRRPTEAADGDGPDAYKPPTFAPMEGEDGKWGSRSRSPHSPPAVPCVAHPVYTAHTNCGCHRSPKMKRRGSPKMMKDRPPSSTPRSEVYSSSPPRTPRPPPFSEPQLIGTVGANNVRFAKVSTPLSSTALVGDKSGLLRLSRAISGEIDEGSEPVFGAAAVGEDGTSKKKTGSAQAVSAMEVFNGDTWCGFNDGCIRVYNEAGELIGEASRHSSSVTSFAQVGPFVYSGGLDWKIFRWNLGGVNPKDGLTKLHALSFGSHNLGVRTMVGEKMFGVKPMLISGSDDSEIRCWDLVSAAAAAKRKGHGGSHHTAATAGGGQEDESEASMAPTSSSYFPLKGHVKGVLALFLRRDVLWSGGEDATVRLWKIGARRCVKTLDGHSSPVVSIKRIGEQNVWTLGKNGQAVVYHVDTQQVIHSMLFTADPNAAGPSTGGTISVGTGATPSKTATGKGPSSKTTPATMLNMKPVQGHIMWVTEPSGVTQSWYCPTPVDPDELAGRGASVDEFERSELAVQQQMELEAAQGAVADNLMNALDEHSVVLMDHLDEAIGKPRTVIDQDAMAKKDQEIQDLKDQLKAAHDAIEELKSDHASAKEKEALEQQLADQAKKNKETEDKLKKLLNEARRKNKDLEERLKNLMGNKDKAASEEMAALTAELAALKEKDADRDALVAKQKKQIDDLKKQLIDCKKMLEATRQQLENSKKELKSLTDTGVQAQMDALSQELENVKKRNSSMQTEMEAMESEIGSLRSERVELQHQLEDLSGADRKKVLDELTKAYAELERLKALMKNKAAEESRVRTEYEAKIAALTKEFQEKIRGLEAEIALLRKKGDDNVFLKEIDALRAEINRLKKELTVNRHHLTRLAGQDMKSRNKKPGSQPRDVESELSLPEPHVNRHEEHNPADPHHMANCVWCNGAILRGVGGTFGVYGNDYREYCRQTESKERFKQGILSPHRSPSANGKTPEPSHADPLDMAHSPHTSGYAAAYAHGSARSRSSAASDTPHTLTPLDKQKPVPAATLKIKKGDLLPGEMKAGAKAPAATAGGSDPQSPSPVRPKTVAEKRAEKAAAQAQTQEERKKQAEAAKEQAKEQPSRAALVAEILALHNEILDEKDVKSGATESSSPPPKVGGTLKPKPKK